MEPPKTPDGSSNPAVSPAAGAGAKVRLMCSYGGHIVPRPHDRSLCYLGGETRVVGVDRHVSFSDLSSRLSRLAAGAGAGDGGFSIKYQLPFEDLDSLVSLTTDEDLEVMLEEHDRATSRRLRLFLFPRRSTPKASVDNLLGLDDDDNDKRDAKIGRYEERSLPNSPLFNTPSNSGSCCSETEEHSVMRRKSGGDSGDCVVTTMCSTECPGQNSGGLACDEESRKEFYTSGLDSSDQISNIQTTEQSDHNVNTNPNSVQFQPQQTTSPPLVSFQSYYPQQQQQPPYLFNPQMPVYFMPVPANSIYALPFPSCDSTDGMPINPPDNPNIPLPSPALLSRGISVPLQNPESSTISTSTTATTGSRSTNLVDPDQQYMSYYYQIPQYMPQQASTTSTSDYGCYPQSMHPQYRS